MLESVIRDRQRGRDRGEIARAFQRGIAVGLCDAALSLCREHGINAIVLSGGVFQNELLLEDVKSLLENARVEVWTNHAVPPNDGGISLGQAALAAFITGSGIRLASSGREMSHGKGGKANA
jgi:hydrogenase maturation protein HypF